MTNKTVKDAVEYYNGVWPDFATSIYVFQSGKIIALKVNELYSGDAKYFPVSKGKFEDYVRENKMSDQEVKKWPMNDFLIAIEVVLNEYEAGFHVDKSGYICATSGIYSRLDTELHKSNIGNFINDSLRPENQIKEQKMKKQYKYVNAGIKTVGELVDRLMSGDDIYLDDSRVYFENNSELNIMRPRQVFDRDALKGRLSKLTTRHPLPWYEQEGVFPCLVKRMNDDYFFVATGIETDFLKGSEMNECVYPAPDFAPLTPEEAAKYGVDQS